MVQPSFSLHRCCSSFTITVMRWNSFSWNSDVLVGTLSPSKLLPSVSLCVSADESSPAARFLPRPFFHFSDAFSAFSAFSVFPPEI